MLRKRADKDQLTTELTFNKNVLLQLMSSINRMMFDLKAEMTKTEFMIFFHCRFLTTEDIVRSWKWNAG